MSSKHSFILSSGCGWSSQTLHNVALAYRKGSDNGYLVADALSRAAPGQYEKGGNVRQIMTEAAGANEVAVLVQREMGVAAAPKQRRLHGRAAKAHLEAADIRTQLRAVGDKAYIRLAARRLAVATRLGSERA
jgi:hypothetical protein